MVLPVTSIGFLLRTMRSTKSKTTGTPIPDRQGNHRWNCAVRDDPVVNAHRKQRWPQARAAFTRKAASAMCPQLRQCTLTVDQNQWFRGRSPAATGARIGFGRRSYQEGITGIFRGDGSLAARSSARAGLDGWIRDLEAFVGLVDPQKDQRGSVLHDQDGGKNQRRNVDNAALGRLEFRVRRAGPPGHTRPPTAGRRGIGSPWSSNT